MLSGNRTLLTLCETEQDPVGPSSVEILSDANLFCVPHFLFVGKKLQPPRPSLSTNGQIQTVAYQGREGMQKQRRSSQETIVQ